MSTILVENFEDGVTLFTINRPERRNAICSRTAVALQQAFAEFDQSDQRVAVITGSGDLAFSAGADVNDVPELWRCIPTVGITTEKPVIAAIGGWCVGGALVLATMCDLIVAAENANFSYPEAKLGCADSAQGRDGDHHAGQTVRRASGVRGWHDQRSGAHGITGVARA